MTSYPTRAEAIAQYRDSITITDLGKKLLLLLQNTLLR